jgi:anti-sigma factor RsiW
MSKCHDLQKLLPLYEEGILSDAEKRAVEEHLAQCGDCRREMAFLQKADRLVKNLSPVDEPPWFQQRIMARVREEAGQKSFWQKWFHPLSFRIPVQIAATIVIAVLAVYIYRSGDEQVQRILPGAPQPAIQDQVQRTPVPSPVPPPAPEPQAGEKVLSTVVQKKAAVAEKQTKDKDTVIPSVASRLQEKEMSEIKSEGGRAKDKSIAKGLDDAQESLSPAPKSQENEFKSVQERIADSDRFPARSASPAFERKKEAFKMDAPSAVGSMAPQAAVQPQARIYLLVDDPDAAAVEVENILTRHGARKVTKRITQDRTVIRAEIFGREWKAVLSGFKRIGTVEERGAPGDAGEIPIHVTIEISVPNR